MTTGHEDDDRRVHADLLPRVRAVLDGKATPHSACTETWHEMQRAASTRASPILVAHPMLSVENAEELGWTDVRACMYVNAMSAHIATQASAACVVEDRRHVRGAYELTTEGGMRWTSST